MPQQTLDTEVLTETVVVEAYGPDPGRPLGQQAVKVDWLPAFECARLRRIDSSGDLQAKLDGGDRRERVVPRWHATLGKPYIQGFKVVTPANGHVHEEEFGSEYFRPWAEEVSASLVEKKLMEPGASFTYRIYAFPGPGAGAASMAAPTKSKRFTVERETKSLTLDRRNLRELLAAATPEGSINPADMPVFLPRAALDEAAAGALAAKEVETGGALLGRLCRDDDSGQLFAIVTTQIAAPHTTADATRLTFTPATWAAIDDMIRMRGENELMLGWWHSHPARHWCEKLKCPIENRMRCRRSGEFFSDVDKHLHRVIFSPAYTVALVVSDSYADGVTYPMFGWRKGVIERRGFHVTEGI